MLFHDILTDKTLVADGADVGLPLCVGEEMALEFVFTCERLVTHLTDEDVFT